MTFLRVDVVRKDRNLPWNVNICLCPNLSFLGRYRLHGGMFFTQRVGVVGYSDGKDITNEFLVFP